ncbi:MAG: hypothetical protein RLZZ385_146 [Pseudomonadota bacterium]|jgi:4-amino-4-deoxychorismate lyase
MLINGEPGQLVSANDRGLTYGDGAFETIRVANRRLVLWPGHRQRLIDTCNLLQIPLDMPALEADLVSVLAAAQENGVVKVMVTRGAGGRGYLPAASMQPTRIVQFHALPADDTNSFRDGIHVVICRHRLATGGPLAGLKHLNRLEQVMASMELPVGCQEGIMLDASGAVIEGTRSNLFIVHGHQLWTPALDEAGVAGVMREYLISRFSEAGMKPVIRKLSLTDLLGADEVFMCNSVFGIWPVIALHEADRMHHWSLGPVTRNAIRYQDEIFTS